MKNLIFALWMLLYPTMGDLSEYIKSKTYGKKQEENERSVFDLWCELAFYLYVGYLLYQK